VTVRVSGVHGCKDIMELHVMFFSFSFFFICIVYNNNNCYTIIGGQHRWASAYLAACIAYRPTLYIIFYTLGHKKTCRFYFYDNFGKCGPISIILSLLDSSIKCGIGKIKSSTAPKFLWLIKIVVVVV